MTTEKQICANMKNARKSAGPIDTEVTRFNAVKHGILSRNIVINSLESEKEFNDFLENLIRDLNPENMLQKTIVQKIAIDFWRLRRLLLFEKGRIKERLGVLSNFHRAHSDIGLMNTVQGIYNRVCNELEAAKNEQNIQKINELEVRKTILEAEIEKFKTAINMNLEEECESRIFPSINSVELIIRYETAIEKSIVRKFEILQKFKKLGSFRNFGG